MANQLAILEHATEIVEALSQHRVVIVEGPTGCGKTTQIPRILLRAGFMGGLIGVTQPRRIAAVSVAWRIAGEVGCEIGQEVGYAIRFDDKTSEDTMVKVMTDGILLQEARTDPDFSAYEVIMVDEAHERSLNIDLTLGLLHRALRRRDDLKVVISSATIEPIRFQRFFESAVGRVPLVSVSSRTHPLSFQYDTQVNDPFKLGRRVAELAYDVHRSASEGHILAFMTGEAMIKDCEQGLYELGIGQDAWVLPLYGRLTREEQERVFDDPGGKRKIVLATNIAETSITIPGVNVVIDTGLAKIPRFDGRTGVTSLQAEPISQASTQQRAGRAGRTGPGLVIRLYSERSSKQRPLFSDEEILRLDLIDVVLRLIDIGVRDVENFPLPTAPPAAKIRQALQTLRLFGAIDERNELTEIGSAMVPFPLSPRQSRMVVEAALNYPKVLNEVIVVAAFLSSRPPHIYPSGEELRARRVHDRLKRRGGDSETLVHLFKRYQKVKDPASFCKRYYLDPQIMAFLERVTLQLTEIAKQQGFEAQDGGQPEELVRAVAAAFPDRLLKRSGHTWNTLDGTKVALHPSSALFGSRPKLIVAAELVRSSRVFARHASVFRLEWVQDINPEALASWYPKKRKHAKEKPLVAPRRLSLRGHELKVRVHKDKVMVSIPKAIVPELMSISLYELPTEATRWRARIVDGRDRYLGEHSLAATLAMLPFIPLPEEDAPLCQVTDGVLLDITRNLHTIERHLEQLLLPMRSSHKKRPGWLMLVTNGADGFWYEITPSFIEALEATAEALETLEEEAALDKGDQGYLKIQALSERFAHQRDQVRKAIRAARKLA